MPLLAEGEEDVGGAFSVVKDGLVGHGRLRVFAEGAARVGVPVPAWETAAGDLEADAVAGLEEVAGRPEVDVVAIRPVRLDRRKLSSRAPVAVARPQDAVGQVDGPTVGVDVAETGDEVGVRCAGGGPEPDADRAGDLGVVAERLGGEDQYVGPLLDRTLVVRTCRELGGHEERSAPGGDGVGGVVVVAVGALLARSLRAESAAC